MIKILRIVLLVSTIVIGVTIGILVSSMLVFPMIDMFMCDSVWEQGCGPYHTLKIGGALITSGLAGLFAGWGAASLFYSMTKVLSGKR